MFKKIRHPIEQIKDAFRLLVVTLQNLRVSVEALTAEQTEIRERLDAIAENTYYLASEKKNELRRAGHKD